MCSLLADRLSTPPMPRVDEAARLHQSSSGRPTPIWPLRWWTWLDRPLQRIALREIAKDPHLLSDLGLSRDEALREAAKPFWR
jgi:uncharacterized protein YjiS (DUF1127 family)